MKKAPPLLVAIVGGSGSGKSWLAEQLDAALAGKALRVSLDDFYRDRSHLSIARRSKINFDHPAAIDWTAFRAVLQKLSRGSVTRIPAYDFATHSRLRRWHLLKARSVILVEGLWLLRSPSLRRQFDLRLFLECSATTRLDRRLARDLKLRGRTRASVLRQFHTTVQPMHSKFVEPQARWADIILPESFSRRQVKTLAAKISQMVTDRPRPRLVEHR